MYISYQKRICSCVIDIFLSQIILQGSIIILAPLIDNLYLVQFLSSLFLVVWTIFNFPFLQSSKWKGTIGQKILQIEVIDIQGNRLSFWRACYRGCLLTFCPWGAFMYFFSPQKQCLHDFLSDTLVVTPKTTTSNIRSLYPIKYSIIIIFFLINFVIPSTILFLIFLFS